jgi:hypothetical protein
MQKVESSSLFIRSLQKAPETGLFFCAKQLADEQVVRESQV